VSQENVEIVRAMLAAYRRSDEAAVRQLAAPDIVISTRPDQPDPSDRRGAEGVWQAGAEWVDAWDEHIYEETRLWDSGDFVFVCVRESGRGRTSRVPMEAESIFVFTVRHKKVARMQIFASEHEALKAVGLEE
jgi:ketosteroid isomerase-like protein